MKCIETIALEYALDKKEKPEDIAKYLKDEMCKREIEDLDEALDKLERATYIALNMIVDERIGDECERDGLIKTIRPTGTVTGQML
jgi:hypothetical protein